MAEWAKAVAVPHTTHPDTEGVTEVIVLTEYTVLRQASGCQSLQPALGYVVRKHSSIVFSVFRIWKVLLDTMHTEVFTGMVSCQLKYPVEIVLPWFGALCWWTSCPWRYYNTSGMWRHAFLQLHLKLNQTNYFSKVTWAVKFLSPVFQTAQGGVRRPKRWYCGVFSIKHKDMTPCAPLCSFFLKLNRIYTYQRPLRNH